VLRRIETHFHVRPLPPDPGSSSRDYHLEDRDGRSAVIGVIAPCSMPFCGSCGRLRLTARGELLGCLAQGEGIDLRPMLRGPCARRQQRILAAVGEALRRKHNTSQTGMSAPPRRFTRRRRMVAVGG
jgi:cyclic pyranopterin phosphate synthase